MAGKGSSIGGIEDFARSLGIQRTPAQKEKSVPKKQVSIKSREEQTQLGAALKERYIFVKKVKKEYQKLANNIAPKGATLTSRAINKEKVDIQKNIESMLGIGELRVKLAKIKSNVGTLEELKAEAAFEKNENGSGKISQSLDNYKQLKPIFRLISRESGVPEKELLSFVAIESLFKPEAYNGSARGFGQMQKLAAITSVRKLNPKLSTRESARLGSQIHGSRAIYDPLINLRLTAEYWKHARDQAISGGFKNPTLSMVYTYYNQGAGDAKRVIKGGPPRGKNPWYSESVKLFSKMPGGDFEVKL